MIYKLHKKKKNLYTRRLKNSECVQEAMSLGCSDAKMIMTESVITGHWVRMKCQYGCESFAAVLTCPPFSPSIEDAWDLLGAYRQALLIRGETGTFVRETVAELEKIFVAKGFHKAFGLGSGPCKLCSPCDLENGCKFPHKARPSMTACGIDVFKTVQGNGWKASPMFTSSPQEAHFGLVLIE